MTHAPRASGPVPTPWRPRRAPGVGPLPRAFYARSTLEVAGDLLGKVLVHDAPDGLASGIIVEVEAYIGEDDPACHAAPGPTVRNQPLYGPPGFAYVYLNYGLHHLVNVVTEAEGHPAAVLIRALEPCDGVELMRARRCDDGRSSALHELCRGPGRLTRAMGIVLSHNRCDLTEPAGERRQPRLWIEDRGVVANAVSWGPRVGIRVGTEHPWRGIVVGNPSVSPWRPGQQKRRRMQPEALKPEA